MHKYLLLIIFLAAALLNAKLKLKFFGSETCGECYTIKEEILLPLAEELKDKVDLELYYIERQADNELLIKMEKEYNVSKPKPIELFFPDTVLLGGSLIKEKADSLIRAIAADSSRWQRRDLIPADSLNYSQELLNKFSSFSLGGIILAGLADGINPCAIATIIFLISFLVSKHRSRKEIILIGLLFSAAVYVTYFLIGLGAFQVIMALESYRVLSKIIKYAAVIMAGLIGLYSFYDAFVFHRSKKASEIKLQLPKSVKMAIHRVISKNLQGKNLIFWTLLTGFLVTLLEAVCTGQVYLPTIILIAKTGGLQLTGWLYLALYNFLFILPLLIIVILVNYGLTWQKLVATSKNTLTAVKIILGCVMLLVAAFLLLAI